MGPRAGRQSSPWGFKRGVCSADGGSERAGCPTALQGPRRAPGPEGERRCCWHLAGPPARNSGRGKGRSRPAKLRPCSRDRAGECLGRKGRVGTMKGDGKGAKVRRAEGCRWAMGQAWCPTQDHGELQPCQASLQTSAG